MAYTNSTSKRSQVLAALEATLGGIAAPTYGTDVKRASVMRAAQLTVAGGEMPAVAAVPVEDSRVRSLACNSDEYRMRVEIVCARRADPTSSQQWQDQIHLFAAAVQQAIANNRQLSGTAVCIEVEGVEVADFEADGNRSLNMAVVSAVIVYRVGVSDVTT